MNDKAKEVIHFFAQIAAYKQTISNVIQNFFALLFEVITQFILLILCVLPFIGSVVLLVVFIQKTVRYISQIFSMLDQRLVSNTLLRNQVQHEVVQAEQVDYEKETAQWRNKVERLVDAREYYQKEHEKLLSKLKKMESQVSNQVNVSSGADRVEVLVPNKELSVRLYKSDMKKHLREVLSSVEEIETKTIYREAIEEFTYELFVMQIRYALPYKIIMRLFEIYNEEKLKEFYHSFSILMDTLKVRKYKKIYRNSYYSSEQKMQLFAQSGLLDRLDKEFNDFLFYLLNKYNYQQVRELYQHFNKVWSIRYYQGTIKIMLASEAEISSFKCLWGNTLSYSTVEFVVQSEIKKGVIIQSAQTSVDLSYQQLIEKYIDHIEMGVNL